MHKELKREATRPPASEPARPAAQVRSLPALLQRGAPSRRHRRRAAWRALGAFAAALPGANRCARVSEPPGGAARERRGHVSAQGEQPFLSNALADETIGFEEVGDGLWNIVYYRTCWGGSTREPAGSPA